MTRERGFLNRHRIAALAVTLAIAIAILGLMAGTAMAATSFVGAGTVQQNSGAASTSISMPVPSGAVGDLLLLQVNFRGGSIATLPDISANWTLLNRTNSGTTEDDDGQAIYYRVATATSDSNLAYAYNMTGSTRTRRITGCISRWGGVDTSALPVTTSRTAATAGTSLTASGTVTTVANTRIVALFGTYPAAGSDISTPTAMTSKYAYSADRPSIRAFDQEIAAIGATGNKTATASSGLWVAHMVALKPASTVTTITVTATASNKIYDGNTVASVVCTAAGIAPGDSVTITYTPPATFNNKNVGTGKLVTVSNLSLTGASAAKYVLSSTTATTTANITQRAITVTAVTDTKTYNGTTSSTVIPQLSAGTPLAIGDSGTWLQTFDSKDVGSSKTLTPAGTVRDLLGLGADVTANYLITFTPVSTGQIDQATVTVTADDKTITYGDADPTLTFGATGFIGTDGWVTEPTGAIADPHVDAGDYAISFSGGVVGANYTVAYVDGTLTVDPATVTVTADDKIITYGDADPALTFGATGFIGEDGWVTEPTGAIADPHVDAGDYAISFSGGDAGGNYTIDYVTGTLTVDLRPISLTAVTASKAYDGTTSSTVEPTLGGTLATGDTGTWTQTFDTADIGEAKTLTPHGTVKNGSDVDVTSNYDISGFAQNVGEITAKALTMSGAVANDKSYDGTDTATVDFGSATLVGVVPDELVDYYELDYTAAFDTKEVGTDKPVTVAGVTLTGGDASNYTLTQPTGLTADVTPKALTMSGAVANDRPYDGTETATVDFTGASLVGVEPDDMVDFDETDYTAAFDTKEVGIDKPVTVAGVILTGGDASNYTLTQPTGLTADVTPKALTMSGAVANDKTYNATDTATVDFTGASLVGVEPDDMVDYYELDYTAAFDTKEVGTDKDVTVAGVTLTGGDASNYTLTQPVLLADITPKALTMSGAVALDKSYDGTTTADVNFDSAILVGVEPDDVVDYYELDYTAAFDTKAVGADKPVTVAGVTLTGGDASNYTLTQPTGLTAEITPKALTFTGANRVYNASTAASLTPVGIVTGDAVTPVYVADFGTPDVGNGKGITVTGLVAITGADAGNYTVTQPADLTANVTVRPITATAANTSKVFGTADPALTYSVTSGSLVGSDDFTGALTRTAGEAIGSYPITKGTLDLSTNYDLTFVGATFTITTANKPVDRLGGNTRYDVTVATAQSAFPAWTGVKHVVLASGEDRAQPDALTAAGLAGVLDAPLMLVPYSSVNSAIENAIKGMPAGVKVHIVGGPASVSTRVESQLRAYGNVASVDRTSGSNRYGTAAAVARRMKTELVAQGKTLPATTIITNGNFPTAMFDALTASAISAHNFFPVLLVRDGSVPGETSAALSELGLSQRYIIGGTTSVKNTVQSALGVPAANRIAGATRYSTATAAANRAKAEGWLANSIVGFAAKVPDAATGGAFMGKNDGALVYVTSKAVPGDTANYLTGAKASINSGVVFGGTTSVPEGIRSQLYSLIK